MVKLWWSDLVTSPFFHRTILLALLWSPDCFSASCEWIQEFVLFPETPKSVEYTSQGCRVRILEYICLCLLRAKDSNGYALPTQSPAGVGMECSPGVET